MARIHKLNGSEHQLQKSVVDYINLQLPALRPYFFAIPNGGTRDIITAVKLKSEGVTAGIADTFILLPLLTKHGCWIEFKVGNNQLTEKQEAFRDRALRCGYGYYVCRTLEAFQNALKTYFQIDRLTNSIIKEIIENNERIYYESYLRTKECQDLVSNRSND